MAMSARAFSFPSAMRSEKGAIERCRRVAAIGALACVLAGCDKIGDLLDDEDDTFHIRSLNLVEDSPALNFLVDDTNVASAGYGSGSAFSAAHPGNHTISLKAVLPGTLDEDDDDDDPIVIGGPVVRSFAKDTPYTVIAYGRVENPQVFFVDGWNQRDSVANDKLVLQFTHAAPAVPQVDVYVTLPQAGIATAQQVATLSLTTAGDPMELSLTRAADDLSESSSLTGELTVEIRAAGSTQTLYKSDKIGVGEQSRLLFAIAGNGGPGPSPLKLVSMANGSGSTGTYMDTNERAALRFVHVSATTPSLDVTAGSSFSQPLAQNVGFRQSSGYLNVRAGEVGMIAVPTGNVGVFVFLEEFEANAGATYSAYAIGPLAEVDAVIVADEARRVPTQTSFRFLHAAASLQEEDPLDIYLRSPGEKVDFDDDDTTPTYASVPYQTTTTYSTLKEGTFEVYFAYAGTSTVVLGPVTFNVANGGLATLVLLDSETGQLELMPVADGRP
jgi:hypothetical protein